MAEIVYLLCALTSLGVAFVLLRSYLRHRTRLLFWSSVCFVGMFLNNLILYIDLVATPPTVDLSLLRAASAAFSGLVLLYGLIWESE